MSTYPTEPGHPQGYFYQPPPTNGLGIAGFVVSLSGMIICLGLICPIGLAMSLIALTKHPRGYAIAGSIIGLLGSVLGVLAILVATNTINLNLFGSPYYGQYSQTYNTIEIARYDIDNHFRSSRDTLPDESAGDALISGYYDEWNNSLKYIPTPGSTTDYTVTSPGPDGMLNTIDDIVQYYTAQTQTEIAMENANSEIDHYLGRKGSMPDAQTGSVLIIAYQDTWGNALQYEPVKGSADDYNLTSAGPDGQFGTADDITLQFTAYQHYAGPQQTDPADLEQEYVDAAFELAARQIVQAFPLDAALPTQAMVDEKAGEFLDAWSVPMRYHPTDNPPIYHLKSAGPDQAWDTDDDITRSFYFAPTGETDGPL